MVWWIAAKAVAPLAGGILGVLLRFLLLVGVVFAAAFVVGVNPFEVVFAAGASLIDMVFDAIADRLASEVGL